MILNMHLNLLKKMYNKKIRCACNDFKFVFEECLLNNFNDKEYCKNELESFESCVTNFNKEWDKKYGNNRYYIINN